MPSATRFRACLRSFGPGLLWAGSAIGLSHLVQSTRAGADAGLGLAGVILFALVFKYPFFVFGPRYAAATGESLVEGYLRIVTADRVPPQYRPGPGMRMLSYTGLAVLGLVAVAFLAGFLI